MPEPVSCTEPTTDDYATNNGKVRVTFRLQLVVVNASGHEHVQEVARIERDEVAMETLGLTLAEGKLILKSIQEGKCQDSRRCETTKFSVYLSKNPLLLITPPGTST